MNTYRIDLGDKDSYEDSIEISTLNDVLTLQPTLADRMKVGCHTHATLQILLRREDAKLPIAIGALEWERQEGKLIVSPVADFKAELQRAMLNGYSNPTL